MKEAVLGIGLTLTDQDRRISEAIERDERRLRNFIRRRVANIDDAEDILQDVFYELVEATRLMKPIEHVSAWLFRVARNRITDLFRKKKAHASTDVWRRSRVKRGCCLKTCFHHPTPAPRRPTRDRCFSRSSMRPWMTCLTRIIHEGADFGRDTK